MAEIAKTINEVDGKVAIVPAPRAKSGELLRSCFMRAARRSSPRT